MKRLLLLFVALSLSITCMHAATGETVDVLAQARERAHQVIEQADEVQAQTAPEYDTQEELDEMKAFFNNEGILSDELSQRINAIQKGTWENRLLRQVFYAYQALVIRLIPLQVSDAQVGVESKGKRKDWVLPERELLSLKQALLKKLSEEVLDNKSTLMQWDLDEIMKECIPELKTGKKGEVLPYIKRTLPGKGELAKRMNNLKKQFLTTGFFGYNAQIGVTYADPFAVAPLKDKPEFYRRVHAMTKAYFEAEHARRALGREPSDDQLKELADKYHLIAGSIYKDVLGELKIERPAAGEPTPFAPLFDKNDARTEDETMAAGLIMMARYMELKHDELLAGVHEHDIEVKEQRVAQDKDEQPAMQPDVVQDTGMATAPDIVDVPAVDVVADVAEPVADPAAALQDVPDVDVDVTTQEAVTQVVEQQEAEAEAVLPVAKTAEQQEQLETREEFKEVIKDRDAFVKTIAHDPTRMEVFRLYSDLISERASEESLGFELLHKLAESQEDVADFLRSSDAKFLIRLLHKHSFPYDGVLAKTLSRLRALIEKYLMTGEHTSETIANLKAQEFSLNQIQEILEKAQTELLAKRYKKDSKRILGHVTVALTQLLDIIQRMLTKFETGVDQISARHYERDTVALLKQVLDLLGRMVKADPQLIYKLKKLAGTFTSSSTQNQSWTNKMRRIVGSGLWGYLGEIQGLAKQVQGNPALVSLMDSVVKVWEESPGEITAIFNAMSQEQGIEVVDSKVEQWKTGQLEMLDSLVDVPGVDQTALGELKGSIRGVKSFKDLGYKVAMDSLHRFYQARMDAFISRITLMQSKLKATEFDLKDKKQVENAQRVVSNLLNFIDKKLDKTMLADLKKVMQSEENKKLSMTDKLFKFATQEGIGNLSQILSEGMTLALDIQKNKFLLKFTDLALSLYMNKYDLLTRVIGKLTGKEPGVTAPKGWRQNLRGHLVRFQHKGLQPFVDQAELQDLLDTTATAKNPVTFTQERVVPFIKESLVNAWRKIYQLEQHIKAAGSKPVIQEVVQQKVQQKSQPAQPEQQPSRVRRARRRAVGFLGSLFR